MEIKSFKEFLSETPVAHEGDYWGGQKLLKPISKSKFLTDYKIVDNITLLGKKYNLITSKVNSIKPCYYVGNLEGDWFNIIFGIKFNFNVKLGIPEYGRVIAVDTVCVDEALHGRGIAKQMYQYFIKKFNVNIMSDGDQFYGARKLWAALSKKDELTDVTVDVVNCVTNEILKRDEEIYHGKTDDDFDVRYWSRSNDDANTKRGDYNKQNIRFILRKITK